MATVTSSVSGNNTTYVVTDQASNTLTIVATPVALTFTSSGALLQDGQDTLQSLVTQLCTGLRPNAIPGQNASFSN